MIQRRNLKVEYNQNWGSFCESIDNYYKYVDEYVIEI